ncbi:hypothetical protein VC83_01459 [Pseudogymnoascus destructans]|uniref:Uncharacterized protein n=2 Tax=Pseudogymnoascus destructans TaxID=655981 RepID=L8FM63_PSED2|nr:uncharacterized protein VC83_01459 [Pseudogymnoascus destructans]ELR02017.1 hypothetical protein GMDG_05181 [Pseudogymnoascus destructans 20631-21]OAF62094.1 hypothetical protein VC83_01459 [Pseudogymnoascus destructans]
MRLPRGSSRNLCSLRIISHPHLQPLTSVYISHHAYQAGCQHSTLIMASTEMIQIGLSLASPRPATPPSSPTMSDEDASEILAAIKMQPTSPDPHCHQSELLPFAQQFLDVLKSLNSMQSAPAVPAAADKVEAEDPPARASKLEFKTVNEVWDAKTYKYKVVESVTRTGEADELNQYVFVVRGRIDKDTTKITYHVDIKSEMLRDALRNVLKDAHAVSTKENNLSVEQNLLYHYIPELETCRK